MRETLNETPSSPLGATGSGALIARYRHWYAQERAANEKMLTMIESVPEAARSDDRFVRAVTLAAHLAACRENYLEILQGCAFHGPWWPTDVPVDTLRSRYAQMEAGWNAYLDSLTDDTLVRNFDAEEGGYRYRWNTEGQIFQLLGHAYYHRGQISLLVDALGGTTVDTDYVDWAIENDPRFGGTE